ncbi:MAG: High molecular weight rubredoxin [Firmicutes bacterium ADurb.Bin080]|jgi:flavin reductase (DIM6/NTAB) family NADH-FMN oxidoreductase RutF/rubredoxin|nr:flavin reductase [Clostridiales bacterium]OQC14040.1 MAG: High molecular weight rubredoxin [Firmicutes bacterium ADurb.Bin080]
MNLLFKISYGLYVLAAHENDKDNGCIINTLMQQTSSPEVLTVTVNKLNCTHDMIEKTGIASCAIISEKATFDIIKGFGMRSGKTENKYEGVAAIRAKNGCLIPTDGVIGYFDLKVSSKVDMGTHTQFICQPTDRVVFSEGDEPLTYSYYQKYIKPRPSQEKIEEEGEAYICTICGYIHKGPISDDIICPICKHGREAFVPLKGYKKEEKMEKPKAAPSESEEKYICTVCGYIHNGPITDDIICPICKHGREAFVPYLQN